MHLQVNGGLAEYVMKVLTEKERLVNIEVGKGVVLEGSLVIPADAKGLVLFAHGSGSSRHSPRNNFAAQVLRSSGMGTLLMDLLTREEDLDYEMRFNIALLAERLEAATIWLSKDDDAGGLPIGYFGASTGAAAALISSVSSPVRIAAIVSRGGRPDLAADVLAKVKAPTLLIVGGRDEVVIELNRNAYGRIKAEKEIYIVPGATHLFEEPGTLEEAANQAARWFKDHFEL